MQAPDTASRAEAFHRLHHADAPLVLVNCWDVASARIVERAGAAAIATSSAAMAWSLGCADGEQLAPGDLIAACARIGRASALPLTVDIERGFGRTAADVCALVAELIGHGAVGINIEDGIEPASGRLADADVLCERIAALRALAGTLGVRLFINARTDTHCVAADDVAQRRRDTVRRARLFAAAGADGIFVPGMDRLDDIAHVRRELALPLNVYAGHPGVPPVAELARAGVRRISLGCGPLQAALGLLERIAQEALQRGRYDAQCSGMLPAREINQLFAPAPPHRAGETAPASNPRRA